MIQASQPSRVPDHLTHELHERLYPPNQGTAAQHRVLHHILHIFIEAPFYPRPVIRAVSNLHFL